MIGGSAYTVGRLGGESGTQIEEVGSAVPVTATNLSQKKAHNSPAVAIDPTEPRFAVVASRIDGPSFDCALAVSGNGGRGWVPARPVPTLPVGADRCYGGEVAFDLEGKLYYLFVGLHGPGNVPMGVFLTTSTDRAQTFSSPRKVLAGRNYMVRIAIDRVRGDRGRIHLIWVHAGAAPTLGGFPPVPNPILAARSDDGGASFSEPVLVSDPERQRVVAPAVAVGDGGDVHVAYYDLRDDAVDYQGLEGPKWDGNWSLVLSSSTNGGGDFSRHRVIDDGIVPPERVMLIFTMPPPALASAPSGGLYIAWHDGRHGDWDVFLRRWDKGSGWQDRVRLNDDRIRSGRHQYLPALSVAPDGRLDVIFYDRRNDAKNIRNHVYYTFSTNHGGSFSSNRRLTVRPSDSRAGAQYRVVSARGLVEFGSRIGLASTPSSAIAAWTDTSVFPSPGSLHQDVFAAGIQVSGGGGGSGSRLPPWLWWWLAPAGLVLASSLPAGLRVLRWQATRGSRAVVQSTLPDSGQ